MSAPDVQAYAGMGTTRLDALYALCEAMRHAGRRDVRPLEIREQVSPPHHVLDDGRTTYRFEVDTVPGAP